MSESTGSKPRPNIVDNRPALAGIAAGCPGCIAGRMHTEEEVKQFHPKAGTGIAIGNY